MIIYGEHNDAPGTIQFENANEGRSYPFADDAVLQASDGTALGEWVVSDMHLVIPKGSEAFVSSVHISTGMVAICVKVTASGRMVSALSCMVEAGKFEPFVPYRLEKLHGSEDVGGIVTFGIIDFTADAGTYRFDDGKAVLCESAVSKYVPARLRKIIDDRNDESVAGDVRIEFSGYVGASRDGRSVRLDLLPGAATALMSKCDRETPVNPCGATPVASINGVRADDKDRIVIWFH